jgi:uncharacterized Zn finger protein (UPF0148 family)
MSEQCPKCKSNNVYYDDGMNACQKCGERWPLKVVIVKNIPALCAAPQLIEPDNFSKEREYMKNKLSDLNNTLFAQLERLNEEATKGNKLSEEINRAKAITGVAHEIILNGKLVLDAMVAVKEKKIDSLLPVMIGMEKAENAK